MSSAIVCCIYAALVIIGIFAYFLIGAWSNTTKKRLGLCGNEGPAWLFWAAVIEGPLELFGIGIFDRLAVNIFMGDEAESFRQGLLESWVFKGILIGVIAIAVILFLYFCHSTLAASFVNLLLHLVLDPIALITPHITVNVLDKKYVDAMAESGTYGQ